MDFAKAEQKKEEFSTLKPYRNKTKCVLKTDKSASLGKTRIHSKDLQPCDFHHKLNVSSLADLLTNSQTQHAGK